MRPSARFCPMIGRHYSMGPRRSSRAPTADLRTTSHAFSIFSALRLRRDLRRPCSLGASVAGSADRLSISLWHLYFAVLLSAWYGDWRRLAALALGVLARSIFILPPRAAVVAGFDQKIGLGQLSPLARHRPVRGAMKSARRSAEASWRPKRPQQRAAL